MFRLLICDPDLQALLERERIFEHRGEQTIQVASTGPELVSLAAQVRPTMIIFDADRLEAGLESTVQQIRRSPGHRTTPLIATAAAAPATEKRLKGSGVDLVLPKPVGKRHLYTVLRLAGPGSGLEVRVAVGSEARYSVDGEERTGRVTNLSRGGLYLAAETVSPVGTRVEVTLQLPGFGETVAVTATVRWTNDGTQAPELPPGMGLRFVDPRAPALKVVGMYVAMAKDVVRVT
jgi:uncharacterized protein (TIGR02266 family)